MLVGKRIDAPMDQPDMSLIDLPSSARDFSLPVGFRQKDCGTGSKKKPEIENRKKGTAKKRKKNTQDHIAKRKKETKRNEEESQANG
jgi:hypothetical protein